MKIDFPGWQGQIISGFGFLTTLIFCIEGITRIAAGAVSVIKDAIKGIKGEK